MKLSSLPAAVDQLSVFSSEQLIYDCNSVNQTRGDLSFFDHKSLPFLPKRTFIVSGVPFNTERGDHVHKVCLQFLVCVSGRIQCDLRCRDANISIEMDTATKGILIPAGIWGAQTYLTADAVLLVFASHEYDKSDYIYGTNHG